MKKTLRAFVAVELPTPIRTQAEELIALLADTEADVNWVETHNLHLTLKFLGDVHEREISDVCQAVLRGTARRKTFDLDVCGAGAFPTAARPRTVWLGAGDGESEMIELHDSIEAELAELGYREEHRRFCPHLTLGRVRGVGPAITALGEKLAAQADFSAGRMTIAKTTLFASTLTREGPIYQSLGSFPLGK
jgi:RNA 2',3'-cyclic 3'-phosphodiesterase